MGHMRMDAAKSLNLDKAEANDCEAMPMDADLRLDNVRLHEISEAISHLDGLVSDLERALHIASKRI